MEGSGKMLVISNSFIEYNYDDCCFEVMINIYNSIVLIIDIPDARQRSDKSVEQIGTPLTHERFLRRSFGSYGPRIMAGTGKGLPAHKTGLKRFWTVGRLLVTSYISFIFLYIAHIYVYI